MDSPPYPSQIFGSYTKSVAVAAAAVHFSIIVFPPIVLLFVVRRIRSNLAGTELVEKRHDIPQGVGLINFVNLIR